MCLFLHRFTPVSHSCSTDKSMASDSSDQFFNWMSVSRKHQIHEKHKESKGSKSTNWIKKVMLDPS